MEYLSDKSSVARMQRCPNGQEFGKDQSLRIKKPFD